MEGTFEDRSKDFWMFSYFCNGINFRDLAKLKYKNIDGEMLRFIREKTKKTSQGNQHAISCYLSEETKSIIKIEIKYKKSQNLAFFKCYIDTRGFFAILTKNAPK